MIILCLCCIGCNFGILHSHSTFCLQLCDYFSDHCTSCRFDTWVVKKVIMDRILVVLRWWNGINNLGEIVWKFESLDQEVSTNINLWTRKITLGIAYHFLNCYMKILLGKGKTFCFFLSNFVICCIVIGTLEQGLMAVFELEFYSK